MLFCCKKSCVLSAPPESASSFWQSLVMIIQANQQDSCQNSPSQWKKRQMIPTFGLPSVSWVDYGCIISELLWDCPGPHWNDYIYVSLLLVYLIFWLIDLCRYFICWDGHARFHLFKYFLCFYNSREFTKHTLHSFCGNLLLESSSIDKEKFSTASKCSA